MTAGDAEWIQSRGFPYVELSVDAKREPAKRWCAQARNRFDVRVGHGASPEEALNRLLYAVGP